MYLYGNQWVANRSTYPQKSKSSFTTSTINRPKWAQTFLQMRNVDTSSVSRMIFHVREAGLRTNPDTRLPRSRAHYIIATLLPIRSRSVYLIERYIRARECETCDIFAAGFLLKSIANVFVRWTRVVRFESCVLENFNVIWLQVDRM